MSAPRLNTCWVACRPGSMIATPMIKEHLNPTDLPNWSESFSQVVVVRTGTTRTIYVSGQVSVDAGNNVVGHGDLGRQAQVALENLSKALAAAGATPADVVRWASTSKTTNEIRLRSSVRRCATHSRPSGCRRAPGSVFLRSRSMRS